MEVRITPALCIPSSSGLGAKGLSSAARINGPTEVAVGSGVGGAMQALHMIRKRRGAACLKVECPREGSSGLVLILPTQSDLFKQHRRHHVDPAAAHSGGALREADLAGGKYLAFVDLGDARLEG